MELKGELIEIIYQNEINGYTVGLLETYTEIYTVVGYLPFITTGDILKVEGKFVMHQEYGKQFKIETFEKVMPENIKALEKYLGNGNIKGIGPATAKKIVTTFGEETINIFRTNPIKLSEIKGISEEKALDMAESFIENWDLWQIVGFLDKFGISASSAKGIYEVLGPNTIEKVKENPYVLVDLARGVDFKKIDKMALDIGISYNDTTRVKSGIKYSLNLIEYNGNTCAVLENLYTFVEGLLNVERKYVEEAIINLKATKEIIIEKRDIGEFIYSSKMYNAEEYIAERLIKLDKAKNIKKVKMIDVELSKIEENSDLILSEKQKEAIKAVNNHNVCIITGGPGTGKTTIIKSIIELFKNYGKKVVLCAPTGRAAKKMTETTGEDAKTLHRLLCIGKLQDDNISDNVDEEIEPIDADVIIVDEMSMVDTYLMNYLVKGIYLGTKLVLVGDADQLPSVGPGSVLKDIVESEKIVTIKLDKIFRQAAQSQIILNAHRVNEGEKFFNIESDNSENDEFFEDDDAKNINLNYDEDFFFVNESNIDKIMYQVLTLCKDRLKKYNNYDFFKNIQVITPTKKGMLGTKELNVALQNTMNPPADDKEEKVAFGVTFREGDKVMQIKNNYDIMWEKDGKKYEVGTGVFNGELGIVEKIDNTEKRLQVRFDDEKTVWYSFQDLEQLEHSYAITIHKSQGSEFDVVIIPIAQVSRKLLTRNLLYTAITRAKKMLIILGSRQVIEYMIDNIDIKKRNTGLAYKMKMIE